MKTAINFRSSAMYLTSSTEEPGDSNSSSSSGDHALTGKIETLKESMIHLIRELDTLKVIASKVEAFKTIDAVIGDGLTINFHEMVRRFEIDLIQRALEQTGGHQIRAARILGMNVTTLNSMIKRYRINPLDFAVGSTPEEKARQRQSNIVPVEDLDAPAVVRALGAAAAEPHD